MAFGTAAKLIRTKIDLVIMAVDPGDRVPKSASFTELKRSGESRKIQKCRRWR